MFEPKEFVYSLLQQTGERVFQARPEVIEEFPCITFYISDNSVNLELARDIAYQEIEVVIDIWANTSQESGSLHIQVEEILREADMTLISSIDVPDPSGYSHINATYKFLY
jgi:thioredoxin-like negative regulator of GroEL